MGKNTLFGEHKR